MLSSFPSYFSKRSVLVYFAGITLVSLFFFPWAMPWYWVFLGIFSVVLFFYLSRTLSSSWRRISKTRFEKRVFWITVVIRAVWILLFYFLTELLWGTPWEQPIGVNIDSSGYYDTSTWIIELAKEKRLGVYFDYIQSTSGLSDCGYPLFLAFIRIFIGKSILLTRIPNGFFDAGSVILVYRLAKRNFGEETARISAIFLMLMPMMFYFAATTMKESLMLFLMVLAIEEGDKIIFEKKRVLRPAIIFILASGALFTIRTVLAVTVVLSLTCGLVLTSSRLNRTSKKWTGIIAAGIMAAMFFGGSFAQQIDEINTGLESTEYNFEYRATREGGNSLVGGLSKIEFAPLIFTIPFPTMVGIEDQQAQQIMSGGSYVKNVLSFFCILGLLIMVSNKEWKGSIIVIASLIGYLIILCFSSYAQSARFHMPAIPFEMIFAAYGVTHFNKVNYKHLFNIFLVVEFIVLIGWNWFKLRGRGIV